MGENGAGKRTLIKILTGVCTGHSGESYLEGKPINNHSPEEAQTHGISTVYQEVNLCTNISVAENIFAGHEPKNHLGIDWNLMNKKAHDILGDFDLSEIDVSRALGEYSVAIQQMVAIARAVNFNCKVLILDEPTSSLDEKEVEKLFSVMRQLKEKGTGIIFVTHFLEQVYSVCDTITVLRNGELQGRFTVNELSRIKLVQTMLGHEIVELDNIRNTTDEAKTNASPEVVKAIALGHSGTIKIGRASCRERV